MVNISWCHKTLYSFSPLHVEQSLKSFSYRDNGRLVCSKNTHTIIEIEACCREPRDKLVRALKVFFCLKRYIDAFHRFLPLQCVTIVSYKSLVIHFYRLSNMMLNIMEKCIHVPLTGIAGIPADLFRWNKQLCKEPFYMVTKKIKT